MYSAYLISVILSVLNLREVSVLINCVDINRVVMLETNQREKSALQPNSLMCSYMKISKFQKHYAKPTFGCIIESKFVFFIFVNSLAVFG